jgi:hypothetical protein
MRRRARDRVHCGGGPAVLEPDHAPTVLGRSCFLPYHSDPPPGPALHGGHRGGRGTRRDSNQDPLDVVPGDLAVAAVVDPRRPRSRVPGEVLHVLQRQICGCRSVTVATPNECGVTGMFYVILRSRREIAASVGESAHTSDPEPVLHTLWSGIPQRLRSIGQSIGPKRPTACQPGGVQRLRSP